MRFFRHYAGFVLLLAPLPLAPLARADVTVRYHTDIKAAAIIPAGALAGMQDLILRIKGNKGYSSQGNVTSIMDVMTQDLLLVDVAHKRFASIPAGQYAQQLKIAAPAIPEQARAALASMKTNLESRNTGRTAAIQGIQADEHEFVLTVDMPLPDGTPMPSPFVKMVMQVWTAKPEETQRVAALQEIKVYSASASSGSNPLELIQQILSGLPGMGDNLGAMMDEMIKNGGMSLRVHLEVSSPVLALMSQQLPGQALPAGLDPNAPLMQMTQEVVELSTGSLEDALFEVPADYQQTSVEEVLKGAVSAAPPPQFKQ